MLFFFDALDSPNLFRKLLKRNVTLPIGPIFEICPTVGLNIDALQHGNDETRKQVFQLLQDLMIKNVVFLDRKQPRISNFDCKRRFPQHTSIEITPSTQASLVTLVIRQKVEFSGQINRTGDICNLKKGKMNWSPLQKNRDNDTIPFHTHPMACYKHFNTKFGWPSDGDIFGIEPPKNRKHYFAHLVVSLEGIYLMTTWKKTCSYSPIRTKKDSIVCLEKNLTKCSWLLLPWSFSQSWFIF
jgi:hypothetical protein